jgi:hypothetical protein
LVESVSKPEFATGVGLVIMGFDFIDEGASRLIAMKSAIHSKFKQWVHKYREIFNL